METSRTGIMLAEAIRQKIPKKTRCVFEIRTATGGPNRQRAEELRATLRIGGIEAEIVEIGVAREGAILIEGSHETAATIVALQTAFLAAGVSVQLLVHNKADPHRVVIHMESV